MLDLHLLEVCIFIVSITHYACLILWVAHFENNVFAFLSFFWCKKCLNPWHLGQICQQKVIKITTDIYLYHLPSGKWTLEKNINFTWKSWAERIALWDWIPSMQCYLGTCSSRSPGYSVYVENKHILNIIGQSHLRGRSPSGRSCEGGVGGCVGWRRTDW